MADRRNQEYLQTKILTATPQKLHLMLIDGALRFGRQARQALESGDSAAVSEPLLRSIDIVGEMLAVVRAGDQPLNQKLGELYLFVLRRLTFAHVNADLTALNEALGVLEFERETWQAVCQQLGTEKKVDRKTAAPASEKSGAPPLPKLNTSTQTGVSLEA